jgi:hypothetical protein
MRLAPSSRAVWTEAFCRLNLMKAAAAALLLAYLWDAADLVEQRDQRSCLELTSGSRFF